MKTNPILLLLLFISTFAQAQKPVFTTAKVKAATVYFNSVEIAQSVSVVLPKGTSEIVVKNVADYLNENTVQIGAPKSVTVLSVQFTNNYISEYEIDEKSPSIKAVRDSIQLVEKDIQKVSNAKDADARAMELLDKNQQVFGANSGLNVTELIKMVDYYKIKWTELRNSYDALDQKLAKLNVTLQNLNNKLEINTQKEDKTSKGKLVIQVMNEVAGTIDFDINYISNNATWKPFYDLRVNSVSEPIAMMYKAQVIQNTGIDWKKVKLTLSSGNPNQNNQAPLLNAWWLQYYSPSKDKEVVNIGYGMKKEESVLNSLQGRATGVQVESDAAVGSSPKIVLRGNSSMDSNNEALYVVDGQIVEAGIRNQINPESIKSMNVLKGDQATALYGARGSNGVIIITTKQGMSDYTEISENELNISFDIDIPYDVLSNGKAHSVDLKELQLPASYKYYAAPRVDKEAFLLAEISDYSKYNLLQGEANIIFEGLYVGKTIINPNQTSDTLNLSMGRDKKISIKREKVADKSGTKFLSSKKEQTFTYDITIRNNKKEAIELLLKDQYPLSPDKEIEIELLDKSNAKVNTETGILTWDLNLKPNETKIIRLSYKVRYPKDKVIGNL